MAAGEAQQLAKCVPPYLKALAAGAAGGFSPEPSESSHSVDRMTSGVAGSPFAHVLIRAEAEQRGYLSGWLGWWEWCGLSAGRTRRGPGARMVW